MAPEAFKRAVEARSVSKVRDVSRLVAAVLHADNSAKIFIANSKPLVQIPQKLWQEVLLLAKAVRR